jgi:hypothetical protein
MMYFFPIASSCLAQMQHIFEWANTNFKQFSEKSISGAHLNFQLAKKDPPSRQKSGFKFLMSLKSINQTLINISLQYVQLQVVLIIALKGRW